MTSGRKLSRFKFGQVNLGVIMRKFLTILGDSIVFLQYIFSEEYVSPDYTVIKIGIWIIVYFETA